MIVVSFLLTQKCNSKANLEYINRLKQQKDNKHVALVRHKDRIDTLGYSWLKLTQIQKNISSNIELPEVKGKYKANEKWRTE